MSQAPGDEAVAAPARSSVGKWLLWGLRIAGTALGFGYIAYVVDADELWGALTKVSPLAFAAACATTSVNLGVGAVRWRVLLAAYGAPRRPSLRLLVRAYYIGFFYNNYLPGGVGGDLVRGVVTRRSFGDEGTTASVTVVLVERALGLAGLLLLVSLTSLIRPIEGTENVLPYSAVGLTLAAAGIGSVALGRRVARFAPGRIGALLGSLPEIVRPGPFAAAFAISLATQSLVAVTGWFLLASVSDGAVGLGDAFVLVPLAAAAAFFPLSVGGAGVREAAFVGLFVSALGMERADAVAVSLAMWGSQLAIGAVGGLVQLLVPIEPEPAAT
ncbi:MAG: flippase-like domain-containing protein [Sandaracinaceae bacterium]|nr:flippase-like domain-containing protein [Sandaracinaceae bacterium]